MVGWSTSPVVDEGDTASCSPKKLGLPVLDREKCLGQRTDIFSSDKGCLGVIGSQSVICKVRKETYSLCNRFKEIMDFLWFSGR